MRDKTVILYEKLTKVKKNEITKFPFLCKNAQVWQKSHQISKFFNQFSSCTNLANSNRIYLWPYRTSIITNQSYYKIGHCCHAVVVIGAFSYRLVTMKEQHLSIIEILMQTPLHAHSRHEWSTQSWLYCVLMTHICSMCQYSFNRSCVQS